MDEKEIIRRLRKMDKLLLQLIEAVEKNEENKEKKLNELRKWACKGASINPIIDNGYFRIVGYSGKSKYIKVGKVYKGSTFCNEWQNRISGVINSPKAYFNEDNATWVLSTKDEYNEQK